MMDGPKPIASVGGIRAEIGSDGQLVYISETGVSDQLWLDTGEGDGSK